MEINELQILVLKNVIEEVNKRQGIPVSFNRVELTEDGDNRFKGTINLSEPRHVWDQKIEVLIKGNKVYWKIEDHPTYSFELE